MNLRRYARAMFEPLTNSRRGAELWQAIGQLRHDSTAAREEIQPRLTGLETNTHSTQAQLEEMRQEFRLAQDYIHLLLTQVQVLQNQVQFLQNESNGWPQKFALAGVALQQSNLDWRRALLQQRRVLAVRRVPAEPLRAPRPGLSFEASLAELQRLAPHAFALWEPRLPVNAVAYEGFPIDSLSVEGHPMADLFGGFLAPLLRGSVLDIGCGPQPVPSYLGDYPLTHVAGIDPLAAPHPFVFHHGVAEFIPWDDASFDCVTVATSLDHVLLLDRALLEIRRVLKPGGRFVAWVSFVAGAPVYDPYDPTWQAEDKYHLFHFDRPWFEELCAPRFRIDEMFTFDEPYHSVFYSFVPR